MTVFELGIDERESAGADAIDIVNRRILAILMKRLKAKKITKAKLADKLELHKSDVSRLLRGNQNLTSRKIGEILWALDCDFDIAIRDLTENAGNGHGLSIPDDIAALSQKVAVDVSSSSKTPAFKLDDSANILIRATP